MVLDSRKMMEVKRKRNEDHGRGKEKESQGNGPEKGGL